MEILGLDHVQVASPTKSESDARRFYGGLLGLSELEKPEALRDRGGVWSHRRPRLTLPYAFQDTDLDLIAERLMAAGCSVRWDDTIPNTGRFYTADLWGNRIEVIGCS